MRHFRLFAALLAAFALATPAAFAQRGSNFYTVLLEDEPLAELLTNGKPRAAAEYSLRGENLKAKQASFTKTIESGGIRVVDSLQVLLNALVVEASPEQAASLERLPGIRRVERMKPLKLHANKALDVNNIRAAWNRLGGSGNAGAGVKIAIIDSGIDQNHPAFKDFPTPMPAGYPRCNASLGDCDFTNNKVIAARSYVQLLNFAFGSNPVDTRPDDISPKDRWGHGTAAAMMAAGQEHTAPIGRLAGVAPAAWLGNYKVFGTEDVNSTTFPNVVLRALEDAIADGMQVATLNLGAPAGYGPNDNFCGQNQNQPCDTFVLGVRAAIRAGLHVVASAGNSGDSGPNFPGLNTIATPGTTPEAITVGAITNSHIWYNSLVALGNNVPAGLNPANARFTDGPQLASALEAPGIDVGSLGRGNLACDALPDNSLNGRIAVVARGDCAIETKVNHVQRAGAIAMVLTNTNNSVFQFTGLNGTSIPSLLIGQDNGNALRSFLGNQPNANLRLNPAFREVNAPQDEIAFFSAQGPSIGNFGVKPDLVAVGTDLYMAGQRNDPNGSMFSANGYLVADGTSFSAPMVAGAAALVIQSKGNLIPSVLKGLLVSSASPQLTDFDNNGRAVQASATAMGAGKLNGERALNAFLSMDPSSIPFGNVTAGNLPSGGLVVRNVNNAVSNISVRIEQRTADSNARVTVAPTNFSMPPGGQTQITVTLSGLRPRAGRYDGDIILTSNGVDHRVPYTYFVSDNVSWNIYALTSGFDAIPNYTQRGVLVKIVDQFGVPVRGVSVSATALNGGSVSLINTTTDVFGIVEADITVGASIGQQVFRFTGGNLSTDMTASVIPRPSLSTDGVRDAARGEASEGFSAGQYISLFGSNLAGNLKVFQGNELALALARASVSFDNEAQGVSVPGRIHFVSPTQINVQIPWECEGLATVSMKVSIGDFSSEVVILRLRPANPAFFEYVEPGTNRRFIAALDGNFALIGSNNAVPRGGVAQLYANGLGRVTNRPGSGLASPSNPLAQSVETPTVSIGGRPAQVLFSGLAPGIVGLYQVNVSVPNDAPTGPDVEVSLRQSGVTSKISRLAIR
jgi:uncharacterized protein (TIGR03437 family)